MTPNQISIMLHYLTRSDDPAETNFDSSPEFLSLLDAYRKDGPLLVPSKTEGIPRYEITDRGRAYCDALCKMPLPIIVWTVES